MTERDFSRLKRERQPLPAAVREALVAHDLEGAFAARPAYQQNDYLAWIARGMREDTRERRLAQLLEELERGDVYMKMDWTPKR